MTDTDQIATVHQIYKSRREIETTAQIAVEQLRIRREKDRVFIELVTALNLHTITCETCAPLIRAANSLIADELALINGGDAA